MQKNYDLLTKTTRKPQLSGALCAGHRVLKPLQNAKPFRWLTAILTLTLSLLLGQTWAQSYQTNGPTRITGTTWTAPAGVYEVTFEAIGGGGGGGNSTQKGAPATGGGGGAYAKTILNDVKKNDSFSITIGQGGSAASSGGNSIVSKSEIEILRAVGGDKGLNNANISTAGGAGGDAGQCFPTQYAHSGGNGGKIYNSKSGAGGGAAGRTGDGSTPTSSTGGEGNDPGGNGASGVSSGNDGQSPNQGTYGGGGSGGCKATGMVVLYDRDGGTGASGAVWVTYKVLTLTVTLNANGGTPATRSFDVLYNEPYGSALNSNKPARAGWYFLGWFTDPEGGSKIEPSTIHTSTENITLYAHWDIDPGEIAGSTTINPCGSFGVTADPVSGATSYMWTYTNNTTGEVFTITGATAANLPQNTLSLSVPGTYVINRYAISNQTGNPILSEGQFTVTVQSNVPAGSISTTNNEISSRAAYSITGNNQGSQYAYQWAYKTPGATEYNVIPSATGQNLTSGPSLVASGDYTFVRYTRIAGCDYDGVPSNAVTIHVEMNGNQVCFDYVNDNSRNWTAPEGTYKVTIEAWGGGGAGGNAKNNGHRGSGGGGGAYAKSIITSQNFHANTFNITVGAGATSSSSSASASSVRYNGMLCVEAAAGSNGANNNNNGNTAGGAGGAANNSTGTVIDAGNQGSNSGTRTGGNSGGQQVGATFGAGGAAGQNSANNSAGKPGSVPGGGGGGAYANNNSITRNGGAGGNGKVCFTYEILQLQYTTNVNYGGSASSTPSTTLYYDTINISNPTREGFTFLGWFDAPTGGNKVEFEKSGNVYLYNHAVDLYLYAHWKIDSGAIASGSIEILPCANFSVSQSRPASDGSTYKWFYTKDNGLVQPVAGATSATLSQDNISLSATGSYVFHRVALNAETGDSLVSDGTYTVTVRDVEGGTIAVDPHSNKIYPGMEYAVESSAAEDASVVSYRWEYQKGNETPTAISATTASLSTEDTPGLLSEGTYTFIRYTTYTGCGPDIVRSCSDTVRVAIVPGVAGGEHSIFPCGKFGMTAQEEVTAIGHSGYRWIYQKQGAPSWDTLETRESLLSEGDITLNEVGTYVFRRLVIGLDVLDTAVSEGQLVVTVKTVSAGSISAGETTICPSGAYQVNNVADAECDESATITYKWKCNDNDYTINKASISHNDIPLDEEGDYVFTRYAKSSCSDSEEWQASNSYTVHVKPIEKPFKEKGTYTWYAPEGTFKINLIKAWGGGGGGGNATTNRSAGSGGGGGAYAQTKMLDPQYYHGTPFTVTVGAGGAGGQNGQPSVVKFGNDIVLEADFGRAGTYVSRVRNSNSALISGGDGGTGTTADFSGKRGDGAQITYNSNYTYISGKGGDAGNVANGGGFGGNARDNNSDGPGNSGQAPGGGGSGAINRDNNSSPQRVGGAGAEGQVVILYETKSLLVTTDGNYVGAPLASDTMVLYYDTITLKTPAREGYTFVGWYDKQQGGNLFVADTIEGGYALYGFLNDTTLYAHWSLSDAGSIAAPTGQPDMICQKGNYIIEGVASQTSNVTYQWKCKTWTVDNPTPVESEPFAIGKNSIRQNNYPLSNPGLYEFTRYAKIIDDPMSEWVASSGSVRIRVAKPAHGIDDAVTPNYTSFCEGGAVTLTIDTAKSYVVVPSLLNPTLIDTLKPYLASCWMYKNSGPETRGGSSDWVEYTNGITAFQTKGTYKVFVNFEFQELSNTCVATSDTLTITVVDDPAFTNVPVVNIGEEICPSGSVILSVSVSDLEGGLNTMPYTYTWQVSDPNIGDFVNVGDDATYSYNNEYRDTAFVSNFRFTDDGEIVYSVLASNVLGCDASSFDYGFASVLVTTAPPPTDLFNIKCPDEDDFTFTATAADGAQLRWYDSMEDSTYSSEAPSHSLQYEDTVVYYVSQYFESTVCESARVPDTLIIRYTGHQALESGSLTQTVCQNSPIDDVVFSFDGDVVPTVANLPAGLTATPNDGALTVSGTPTQAGTFNLSVSLEGTECWLENTFSGVLTVHPTYDTIVYASMCPGETYTVSDTKGYSANISTPGSSTHYLKTINNCDSIVHVVYTVSSWNQFGFVDNDTLIAGWSAFSSATSPIQSDVDAGVMKSVSNITYSDWNGNNITRDGLTSTSPFINTKGTSLGLASGSWTSMFSSYLSNNGKFIEIQTSTKGYSNIKLQFDYSIQSKQSIVGGTDHAFAEALFLYSLDNGNTYDTVPQLLNATIQGEGTSVDNFELDLSTLVGDVIDNVQSLKLKVVFDQSEAAWINVVTSPVTYFSLDNIAITGTKSIDSLKITNLGERYVCTNSQVELEATPPYIRQIDDETFDTTKLTYFWERIVEGVSELVQEGKDYSFTDDEIPEGEYQYVVSVFHGECILSDTITLTGVEPTWDTLTVRHASICSNKIDDLNNLKFEEGDITYIEGMALRKPSIEDLRQPGIYKCWLNIPYDGNLCGDSIITLMLDVKKAFDTTIVENICLGDEYHQYGIDFIPTEEGVYFEESPHWYCSTDCDSIYHVTLIVNSVRSTLTDVFDETLVAWDMNTGINNFRPSCGTRTDDAKFKVLGTNATFTNNAGLDAPSGSCITESTTGALRWPNLFSTCSKRASKTTDYSGVYFEITINPRDYNNLKLNFDYLRENEESTDGQAFNKVNYSYKLGEGLYSEPNTETLTGDSWNSIELDFSDAATLDTDKVTLKVEFVGGERGNTVRCGTITSYYLPSYLTVDNVMIKGDRPARTSLRNGLPTLTYTPVGAANTTTVTSGASGVSICYGDSVVFKSQKDDPYLQFYVALPDSVTEYAFNGDTLMTIYPDTTGYYNILARNAYGCDSVFKFFVTVNKYSPIADCTAPITCSGATFAFAPANAPVGIQYKWKAQPNDDFESVPAQNEYQDSLRGKLVLNRPIAFNENTPNVRYFVTSDIGGCPGPSFIVDVPVVPAVKAEFIAPTDDYFCHGQKFNCEVKIDTNWVQQGRQMQWLFTADSSVSDTTNSAAVIGITMSKEFTLPDTPCDTTYKLYATYTDGAGCIAKDSIALKVDIPAHSFTFAAADNDSTVYCLTDASEPASTLVPKAYSGCGDTLTGVLVGTYVDNPTTITCSGTRTYTYKYTDCKGQDTTWQYVYTISHKAPEMKENAVWPDDSVNQPKIFAQADTSCLYNDAQVKALYQDNCGEANFTVTHVQVDSSTANSGWKITRTYTIANSCGDTVMPKPTMSVSGNDQTPPTYTRPADTVAYLAIDGTVLSDTSKTGAPTNVTDDSGNKCDTTYRDEPYTYACGVSFNRIWRVTDACGNVSLSDSVQKITVKDTLTPRIADNGKLKDTTVYLTAYSACGYTLPDTLKTVAEVNALKADFIKGQNLKPEITMTQDTTNKGACDMYILRTYTVTDTCSTKSATFTHKIFVADTTKPVLAGSWPANITGQNHIYAEADTSGLKSDADIKALFNDCHNITVTHTQAPTLVSNCGWTIVRTYHIEDACHNGFDSTMSVSGANQNAPMFLSGTWPTGASNVNTCLTNPDTSSLKADTAIAKLFSDTCGVYVTHKDSVVVGSTDCNWTIIRTYSIKDSCENEVTSAPFMTVTGGDTSKPVFTCPADLTLYRTADCTYDADTATTHSVPTAISDNCTEPDNLTVVFSDDTVAGACSAAITIKRTWSVTDACENVGQKVQVITILDTITPKMYADSIWIAELDTQKSCARSADTTVFYTDAQVKAKFYDNCSNAVIVTHTQNFEEDGQCFWNAIRTYTISDSCGNTTTRTQKLPGSAINDPLAPTLISENTWPENVTGNDNCFANADTSLLYNDDEVAALFEDQCSVVILVSHEDDTLASADNGWEILRTYTIKDGCGNTVYFDESLPTMSLSGADSTAPVLSGAWPHDITEITACPSAVEDTSALLTDDIVKEMFSDCCAITVTHENETFDVEEVNCGWEVRRTYTITDACNNSTDTTISIFGTMEGEGSAPTRNGSAWPEDITGQNNCFANADTTGLYSNAQIAALFTNECSGVVVTHVDDITSQTSNCAWTITRTYTVKDVCGNQAEGPFTMSVSGSDQTAPALTGTWPKDSSNINKSKADIPAGPTKAAIKALFTDCAEITVDSVRNVTGTDCDWTAKFCYQIKDNCHTVYDTVTYTGGDNENPKFVCPKDTTLNLTVDGTVDASPEKAGKPTGVSDNYTLAADMKISHIDKDTTVICGNTFFFTREWHVADTCGNDSVKTQKITVADTMKPTLAALTWTDSTVYLKIDTTYTLPNAFTTIAEVNGKVAGFIKGNNLDPNLTMVADTQNRNTCGLQVVRTYTVTDICNHKTSSFTHKILVEDTLIPEINGNWADSTVYLTAACGFTLPTPFTTVSQLNTLKPNFISGPNLVENVALKVVADTNNVGTCGWNVVRTYDVKDSCNNKTKSFTHTIYVKDTIAPVLAEGKVWLKDSLNQNRLFANAYIAPLADNDSVKKLFHDCTNLTVTHKDDTLADSDCGWKIRRTYTITDDCNNKKVDSVFIGGSDQTKPVINGTHPQVYTENTNANVNTFTKESTSWNVTATDNNAVSTISYELTGATTGSGITSLQNVVFNTGKTIVKWTVTDVCGNDTTCTDTIKIINVNPITVYISGNTDTVVYDGQEHTLTGYVVDSISNNLYTVADFKLKESAINDTIVKGTLVGSYSMNLNQDDFENVSPYFNNIHFNVTSRDLVIKQNPATITIASGSHTFDASEYDGQPHYFPSYVVKYNGVEMPRTAQDSTKFVLTTGDTLAVTAVGSVTSAADNRDKNNTFTWILQNANCYANEIDTNGLVGTIRFNAFPQTIQIASFGKTLTYDGNAHSYPKYTVKFGDDYATCFADDTTKFILPISGDTVRIQCTASISHTGKVANTFTYTIDHEEMYVGRRDTVIDTLRMTPLTGVEVTITEHTDTVTYNGAMRSVMGYDVTNISSALYNESCFSYNGGASHKTAAGRYAGNYPMGVLSTDFVNTNTDFDGVIFTIVDKDLVINPIQSNIQITANGAEKNYDGTPLTNNGFTFTTDVALVAGDTIVALVTGSQTEAGSSANVVEEYHIWRKKSFNVDMLAASMSTPDAYDDVTNCYTFATPATVAGTLRVNNAFVVVSKDSTDVDCYGKHNGTITIVVEGGKLVYGKYNYEMLGPNSFRVAGQTDDTLYLRGLYPGAYTITFKDGMDSTVTATFSINQPDTMVAEIAAPEELCPNQGSYPVSVTVTGGNGTNAYVWGSNATNVDAASTVVAQIGASDCRTEYTAAVQVTDAKGCVAKDTVKFIVDDTVDPTFIVPADITICRNADGQIDAPTSLTGVPTGYSDNCSNEATLIRHTQWVDLDTTGNVNTLMVIRRQWTVTDSCDNSTVKVQNITVKPGIGVAGSNYVLTAPENIEITLKYGQVDTLLTNIGSAVASNLPTGIDAPVVTDNRPANNRYNEGTTVVIWTATDECGFTVTATQTIVVNYPPCEPVTYEGYVYPAVRVGGNCWLAENLHNTKYADGADVPEYSSYNNDGNMTDDYGLLYSWYSAVRVSENDDNATPTATIDGYIQGLCPENWAIPTQAEYNNLFETAGTTGVLKDLNAQFWLPGAAGTTPNTGFNARGTGFYDSSIDRYMNLLGEAYFWTSDLGATVTQGKCSVITHFCPELINQNQDKGMGFSVRCVRKK